MNLHGKKIGFVLTGSHCTLNKVLESIENLIQEGATVFPIVSETVEDTDTRYGQASDWHSKLAEITGNEPITTIVDAEPIGPKKLYDILVVAPCTGNTIAKLTNGITDTVALMATKAHLRNLRPVVLSIATNDGLGINAKNIGLIINMKNIFLVPFGQDDYVQKANSLVANTDFISPTIKMALLGKQIQPVLIQYPKSN